MNFNLALIYYSLFILTFLLAACESDMPLLDDINNMDTMQMPMDTSTLPIDTIVDDTLYNSMDTILADVIDVSVLGDENNYTFSVSISSPDIDCDQYANWWEVLSEDGNLLYRRILNHSHANEQPFARSGSPIVIPADLTVIVRAWMHPTGYGGKAFIGNVESGFETYQMPIDFAIELASQEPLPEFCLY